MIHSALRRLPAKSPSGRRHFPRDDPQLEDACVLLTRTRKDLGSCNLSTKSVNIAHTTWISTDLEEELMFCVVPFLVKFLVKDKEVDSKTGEQGICVF